MLVGNGAINLKWLLYRLSAVISTRVKVVNDNISVSTYVFLVERTRGTGVGRFGVCTGVDDACDTVGVGSALLLLILR